MSNIKIISDGTARGTQVVVGDAIMRGITELEILPVIPGGLVRAVIHVNVAALNASLLDAEIVADDQNTADIIRVCLFDMAKNGGQK
jgi:hypothetical protein